MYLNPKGNRKEKLCPTSAYDFSVSKINMWGSFTVVLCSLGCWIGVLWWLICKMYVCYLLVFIPAVIIFIMLFFLILKSNGNNDIQIINSDNSDLNMIHLV